MVNWQSWNSGAAYRVVVTRDLPGARWREILADADCEVCVGEGDGVRTAQQIREAIGDRCDGAIGQLTEPWGEELFGVLARAGGRAYSNYAVGYDNVDVPVATARGIAVGNTPGVLTETTAELAVALTFAAARRIGESERFLRAGKFVGWVPDLFLGRRFWGATVGVIGCGRIGAAYARRVGLGCCADVVYVDRERNGELERFFAQVAPAIEAAEGRAPACRRVDSLDELLAVSDVVALHVPLTEETRHLIGERELARMKPDAVLVNTSRGPVIDEAALVRHLRAHPEFRVGLDVFEREPELAPGLAQLDNAVLVPHIGSATVWTRAGMATLAAANVAAVLRGDPVVRDLDVEPFLSGAVPRFAPSIVNAAELGLEREG